MKKAGLYSFLSAIIILVCFSTYSFSQEDPSGSIYIILDSSGSMWGELPDKSRKVETAKKVLKEYVAGDFEGYELAFRVYGHRKKGDCLDSELLIPFGEPDQVISELTQSIDSIKPLGKTPITYSLQEALKDFGDRQGEIILISDGIETCDADPCELVREWREKDVKIKVHVVGLGLDEKSKAAMQCISDAAGTEYHDASSASELSEGLTKIKEEAALVERKKEPKTHAALIIIGVDSLGNKIRVEGTVSREGEDSIEVSSNGRNIIKGGDYNLEVGVLTRNGNLYKPVTKPITVADSGETKIEIVIEVPPSVKAKFLDGDKVQRGSQIYAYQDGKKKEVFKFRPQDEVYIDEGTYEFRSKPNEENDLSVTESFKAGDSKELVFNMVHTVHVYIKMVASGTGELYRENYELWKNGKKEYLVHMSNGARVLPGTYDLILPNRLFWYTKEDVSISEEDEQEIDVTVPTGYITFVYHNADGTRDKDDRVFVTSVSLENGTVPRYSKGIFKNGGEKIPFLPGKYSVGGWAHKSSKGDGTYPDVEFEVNDGDDKEVIIKLKPN